MSGLPHLNNADSLNGPITYKEIEEAISKLNIGKSPGSDGLTAAFYRNFAELLSPILEEVFKEIFQNQHLSFTQCLAIIALIFKKGEIWLVPNYRPISLTNNDYKILVYVLTSRLVEHLPKVIHPNQTAYMPKRFIGTNVCSVQDWIDHLNEEHDGIVLFLDFKKAFDSVSHQFLFHLLEHMGFSSEFVTWTRILYRDSISCIKFRNWLIPVFEIKCGVRQGGPISCHLFNLVGQVLVYSL